MSNAIVFYDIPSSLRPHQAWSPNTWRTRFSLNYKGLPYKTVWVEYPDIGKVSKEIGAAPTSTKADGRPHYTLPAIHDPSTGTSLSDGLAIAEYLDSQYPDTPKLIPDGTAALQAAFSHVHRGSLGDIWNFVLPATNKFLNPRSEEYFRHTREQSFGKRLEDVVPVGEVREKEWGKIKAGFETFDGFLLKSEGEFVMGNTISWADITIVSFLIWFKRVFGETSQEWKDISSWNEGRWAKRLDAFQKYQSEEN
ncbi:hypothetical protein HGRIS_006138 [Hohenbuehelia grisea]|uniref:GST N-terminal domain-containing protein n=1 Tax=Hohenbuehelia grisea TaxID=104357 RepID=A0ABR3K1P2_9AGAR